MFATASTRRAGRAAAIALAALAASVTSAAADVTPVHLEPAHLPITGLDLRPNLVADSPSPGVWRITNRGLVGSGPFVVRIHRVGVKLGGQLAVAGLARGASVSRYVGNVCEVLPPALEVIADSLGQVAESSEADNVVVVRPTHNC